MTARDVVLSFWKTMETNDFEKASLWLSEDVENYSPQSSELITGRKNFSAVNTHYPADGKWKLLSIQLLVMEIRL